ncbi:enolase-phosphatase E1-like [Odontomachus brunneus]|uniref:enolase-phosphatase E1-like n=1 Tax=Odontomachus brunneus TaxID=486640 RepID=UPI0013F1A09C|nr:enolase-phosphatase E1-like [Odontomachus brunneus]
MNKVGVISAKEILQRIFIENCLVEPDNYTYSATINNTTDNPVGITTPYVILEDTKAGGDEIDKELKGIKNMDKQKAKSQKDKLKEQNKSQESVIETLDKSKDETDKKQTNSDDINDTKDLSSKSEEKDRKGSTKEELKDQLYITDDIHVNHNKSDIKIKHKNKAGKNMKEDNGESAESTVQQQTNVPSDDTKEKINIVDENSSTEIAKSSDTQEAPLKNIIERPSVTTKAESKTRQKDTLKKEQLSKSKTKSKGLKLEVECNNKNREKIENSVKEMLKNSPLESNKSLVDAEVKNPKPKVLDSAKVVEVNDNVKGKVNSRKKDKASKYKIKTEVTIDLTSSTVPTSEALSKTKVLTCSDNAEKVIVPKSEQITEEISRIIETPTTVTKEADFKEVPKEIILSPKINRQTEEIIQTYIIHKSDKIERNETEAKESIENERREYRQADAKLKIKRAMSPESPEIIDKSLSCDISAASDRFPLSTSQGVRPRSDGYEASATISGQDCRPRVEARKSPISHDIIAMLCITPPCITSPDYPSASKDKPKRSGKNTDSKHYLATGCGAASRPLSEAAEAG